MKKILETLNNLFAKKNLMIFCMTTVIIFLICMNLQTCKSKKESEQQAKQNEAAMKKEMVVEKNKNGDLQTSIVAYEGKVSDVKKYSEDLAQEIKNLKNRKPEVIIKTTLVYVGDTTKTSTEIVDEGNGNYDLKWQFISTDSSRILEGNTRIFAKPIIDFSKQNYKLDIKPGFTEITKDIKKFDLVVGVVKNKKTGLREIFVTPKDKEVTIGKLEGFVIPKEKVKKWAISVQAGFGMTLNNQRILTGPTISFGISRALFTF